MSTQQPPRSGIASLPSRIDPLSLPVGANPRRDRQVALDELGGAVYESPFGVRYTIREEARAPRFESAPGTLDRVREVGVGAYEAVSGAISDPIGFLRSLALGVYEPVERMVSGEGTYGDMLGTAGMVALPTLGARPDPTVARMFGGRAAQDSVAHRSMDLAERLRDEGLDAEEIWRRTAAEFPEAPSTVLPDGTPVFEFSDAETLTRNVAQARAAELAAQASLPDTPLQERLMLQREARRLMDLPLEAGVTQSALPRVVSGPELFSRYPTLSSAQARFGASLPGGTRAEYYPDFDLLRTSNLLDDDQTRSSVLHEVQHGIAKRDPSIPQGVNPEELRNFALEAEVPLTRSLGAVSDTMSRVSDLVDDDETGGRLVDNLYGRLSAGREAIHAPLKK